MTRYANVTCKFCGRKVKAKIGKQWRIPKKSPLYKLISIVYMPSHKVKLLSMEKCEGYDKSFKSIGAFEFGDSPDNAEHIAIGYSQSEMKDIKRMARRNWS